MARKDPQKSARKWASRVGGASQDYIDAVRSQETAPGVLAARKKETMRARTLAAIDDGTWERNTAAVPLSEWQDAAVKKGATRLVEGARVAESKVAAYQSAMRPEYDRIRAEIRAMPNSTPQERKARMDRNFELMSQLKGKGRMRSSS